MTGSQPPGRLRGRVAIVTGASGTIGAATAAALLDAGAAVVLTSRDERDLARAQERLPAAGAEVLPVPADVTDPAQLGNVVERALDAHGHIDLLINLAGTVASVGLPAWKLDPALWQHTVDVNLTGAFLTTRAVVPVMLRQARGRLLHVSSMAAEVPFGRAAAYAATRAAVNQFVRTLAVDLEGTGVTAVAFNPGPADGPALGHVRTAMFPTRLQWPRPLAWRAAADAAAFIVELCCAPAEACQGAVVSWFDRDRRSEPRAAMPWLGNLEWLVER